MKKNNSIPLITEPHPDGYEGYPFLTLIRYNDENYLNIIDNVINKQIVGYNLDMCTAVNINELALISIAEDWFYSDLHKKYPLSVEISKLGLAGSLSPILRCYPTEFVTRVIGPLPQYQMGGAFKTKRKKKKSIPPELELIDKQESR